jgi:hypothetical protein
VPFCSLSAFMGVNILQEVKCNATHFLFEKKGCIWESNDAKNHVVTHKLTIICSIYTYTYERQFVISAMLLTNC